MRYDENLSSSLDTCNTFYKKILRFFAEGLLALTLGHLQGSHLCGLVKFTFGFRSSSFGRRSKEPKEAKIAKRQRGPWWWFSVSTCSSSGNEMLFFKFGELKERKSDQPDLDIGHWATLRHSNSLNVRSSFCSFCACSCLTEVSQVKVRSACKAFKVSFGHDDKSTL